MICVPVVEKTLPDALRAVRSAEGVADLIELRADYLDNPELSCFLNGNKRGFIITHRRSEEGGRYQGDEKRRVHLLQEAIRLGAGFVDLEVKTNRTLLRNLAKNRNGTKLILSSHDLDGTPPLKELKKLWIKMKQWEPDVIKIVTVAKRWEDNLVPLSLIPFVLKQGQKIVSFCMGDKGKFSRVLSPLIGSAWTYAALNPRRASAPGQLTVEELKHIWGKLG